MVCLAQLALLHTPAEEAVRRFSRGAALLIRHACTFTVYMQADSQGVLGIINNLCKARAPRSVDGLRRGTLSRLVPLGELRRPRQRTTVVPMLHCSAVCLTQDHRPACNRSWTLLPRATCLLLPAPPLRPTRLRNNVPRILPYIYPEHPAVCDILFALDSMSR